MKFPFVRFQWRVWALICAGWLLTPGVQAQDSLRWGVRGGLLFGGPVPAELDVDSADGKPGLGPSVALLLNYQLAPRWRLQAELGYNFKYTRYASIYRADTLMPLELIPGVMDTVPTFYYADVEGKMNLHYLELPVVAQWNVGKRFWLDFGGYAALLLAGSDKGSVRIQIGEGAVFDDTTTTFDNFPEMQSLDYGMIFGGGFTFDSGLRLEIRGTRSLRGLYRKGFFASQGLKEAALFHTHVFFGASWLF